MSFKQKRKTIKNNPQDDYKINVEEVKSKIDYLRKNLDKLLETCSDSQPQNILDPQSKVRKRLMSKTFHKI